MKGFFRENTDIGELIRTAESDFTAGTTRHSKYVDMNLAEDINKVFAYLESKHTSGPTDSQGRKKPFFNVVLAARNIWFRATDIDRKQMKIRSTKTADDMGAFLATVHLQDWMRKEKFGVFLNSWGLNMSAFNESIVKFVEKDGRLIPINVPWNRVVCDQIDFASNPKIELIDLTPAQLKKEKGYDQELADKLLEALEARKTVEGDSKDNKDDYIRLYEIHGELPLSYLTGNDEDKDKFTQQMHVITYVAKKDSTDEFDDYTLMSGKEAKDPYMLTALLPEIDGSIALRGSVKTLFDAQWMQNHSAKAIKDQLDLASKLIFQTADTAFVGRNALSAIQTGEILIHKPEMPITQVENTSHDISSLQAFGASWKQLGNEITGISESMLGAPAPSGTAWRQVNALLQENHSLFELMTENKALCLEDMLRTYIIPYLKKQMDTSDEVAATLEAHDITKIDARYIKNFSTQKSNEAIKEKILSGILPTPEEQAQFTAAFADQSQQMLSDQGNQRFFAPSEIKTKTWKEAFKDLEWEVEVDITNENVDQEAMTTLNTLLQIVTDPVRSQGLNTPKGKFIFNKILERTGTVSTIELNSIPETPQPQPPVDGGQPVAPAPAPAQPVQK